MNTIKSQSIVIDGNPADWQPNNYLTAPSQNNLAHIARDTNGFGQFIWRDKAGDEQPIFTAPDGRTDIIEFRTTGDSVNLYFLIIFSDIPADSATGYGAPMIKISIDKDQSDSSGIVSLFDSTNTIVTSVAAWEYLVTTQFGSGSGTLKIRDSINNITQGGLASIDANTNCIELSLPRILAGMPSPPDNNELLRFTVSAYRADTSDMAIDTSVGTNSKALDIVTNYEIPGDTSNTYNEIEDQIIDYFFDVYFAMEGMVTSPLIISEVLYDPSGSEPAAEFVEIRNSLQVATELRGYRVGDEETMGGGEGMYAFPLSAGFLQPDSLIVIARDGSVFESTYGFSPDFETSGTSGAPDMATFLKWGTGGMSLGNGGDEVLLVDSCETVVDVVVWESASWPGVQNSPPIAAGNGSSIDREPYGFSDRNNMSWDFGLTPDDGNPGNGPDSSSIDTDGDGISNINDNCPETYNPLQSDFDNDGTGDLCDPDIITSDNIGIGFPDPKTKLHISDGLMFLDSQPGGLIMKSSEGDCWILSINNTGQVVTVIADCPD